VSLEAQYVAFLHGISRVLNAMTLSPRADLAIMYVTCISNLQLSLPCHISP